MFRTLSPSRIIGVTLALALAGSPALADVSPVQRHLLAAEALYQQLEYERAMDEIQAAKKLSPSPEESVMLSLYEGILAAELGRRDESRAAFTAALFQRPDAALPGKVSPKVQADFEAVKAEVRAALAKGVRIVNRKLTLSVATVPQLIWRGVELSGEYRFSDRMTGSGIVGFLFGQTAAFELGAEGRYYALGDFEHGMPIGLQAVIADLPGSGAFLMAGPFIGYKKVWDSGFSIDLRAGAMLMSSNPIPTWQGRVFPIFNLNVGWSFFGDVARD